MSPTRTLLLAVSFSLLAGCKSSPQIICQEYKKYSAMTQEQFVKEFEEVKKTYPTVTQFIADYHQLRNAIRRCKGEK